MRTPASEGMPRWFMPAMMALLGLVPLLLSRRTECLPLAGGPGTGEQVCSTGSPIGAWIFAGLCWFCAWFLWVAQKPS
ncbi:hypothetical protein [Luteococcus sp. OSA5]|uniref:hypothetical protein n=1 Tax=Luteococcus sp. OSA5 TaxID=3401630 RepID=UPI003B4311D2